MHTVQLQICCFNMTLWFRFRAARCLNLALRTLLALRSVPLKSHVVEQNSFHQRFVKALAVQI